MPCTGQMFCACMYGTGGVRRCVRAAPGRVIREVFEVYRPDADQSLKNPGESRQEPKPKNNPTDIHMYGMRRRNAGHSSTAATTRE